MQIKKKNNHKFIIFNIKKNTVDLIVTISHLKGYSPTIFQAANQATSHIIPDPAVTRNNNPIILKQITYLLQ